MARSITKLLVLFAVVGCGKQSHDAGRPPFTAALLPPAIAGLMPLHATEADVLAKFPTAKISPMTYRKRKCDVIDVDAPIVLGAYTEPPGPAGKVWVISVHGDGLCDWADKHFAPLPASRHCPGNRMLGKHEYCVEFEGHTVDVACSRVTQDDDGQPIPPTDDLGYEVYFNH